MVYPSAIMAQLKAFRYGSLWGSAAAALLLTTAVPAHAQIELSGAYASRMYEDYIERGPASSWATSPACR